MTPIFASAAWAILEKVPLSHPSLCTFECVRFAAPQFGLGNAASHIAVDLRNSSLIGRQHRCSWIHLRIRKHP